MMRRADAHDIETRSDLSAATVLSIEALISTVRAPMPLLERRRDVAVIVVPPAPWSAPEKSARQHKPEEEEKQDRESEAESPRSIPTVRVRRDRAACSRRGLRGALRQPRVVGDDADADGSEQSDERQPTC